MRVDKDDKLVILENNEPRTTSVVVAIQTGNEHESIQMMIKRYEKDLEEFGIIRFQIGKLDKKRGRPTTTYFLNEEQLTFLLMLMRNNEKVIEFKKKITKEFFRMKKTLTNIKDMQKGSDWKQMRGQSKVVIGLKHDIIKEYTEYAIAQGSTGYKKAGIAYMSFNKMQNKILFEITESFKNIREAMNPQQLFLAGTADQIIEKAIKDGMASNMHYKEINKMAKERVENLGKLLPRTQIPSLEISIVR